MAQLNHFEIMKTCYENERQRVLATAYERASNLEESARLLRVAYANGDLVRIAWLTKTLDVELSTRANVLHENLHMIAGLEAQRGRETATAAVDDRCYCEALAQQGRNGQCEVCKRQRMRVTAPERSTSTPFEPSTIGQADTYRCNVPMCGESGLCDACRARGAR